MTRKTIYWLLAAVALAVLAWAVMREPVQLASTATVTREPLEVSFQEEGKTRLKQRYVVTAPVAGMVRSKKAKAARRKKGRQVLLDCKQRPEHTDPEVFPGGITEDYLPQSKTASTPPEQAPQVVVHRQRVVGGGHHLVALGADQLEAHIDHGA